MKSTHAQTAQAIRKELKQAFPSVKFKIISASFSGGNSVQIKWENGPTVRMIEAIVNKYQYGHFDCMYDLYEHTNTRNDIPQVKYVQTHRTILPSLMLELWEHFRHVYHSWEGLSDMYKSYESNGRYHYPCDELYRMIVNRDLTHITPKDIINEERNKTT